jgi:hypothetical protein
MTVVRDGRSLTLIGSMRLSDSGLAELERLGKIEHVIRVAAYHGMDDRYYRERFGAKVWAIQGSFYSKGFSPKASEKNAYFQPDEWMTPETELPIPHTRLHVIPTTTQAEGLMLLERDGGVVVSGDALQNWHRTDEFFNLPGRLVMKAMGFIKPHNVGPGWFKGTKPRVSDMRKILDLPFEHVLPVHGAEVLGNAREKYRPAIEAMG